MESTVGFSWNRFRNFVDTLPASVSLVWQISAMRFCCQSTLTVVRSKKISETAKTFTAPIWFGLSQYYIEFDYDNSKKERTIFCKIENSYFLLCLVKFTIESRAIHLFLFALLWLVDTLECCWRNLWRTNFQSGW